MRDAHTLYMDLSNLVSIQIKFNFFTSRYPYIHLFSMPMGYIHGCHMHDTKCIFVQKWNVKVVTLTLTLTNGFQ
jgi:hypothetical protein